MAANGSLKRLATQIVYVRVGSDGSKVVYDKASRNQSQRFRPDEAAVSAMFRPKPLGLPMTNHTLFINSCLSSSTYCLVSDRRSAALNWEGVVPSHVRKAR